MKSELLYAPKFESEEEFIKALEESIQYYNNKRIKYRLKETSPVQYRTRSIWSEEFTVQLWGAVHTEEKSLEKCGDGEQLIIYNNLNCFGNFFVDLQEVYSGSYRDGRVVCVAIYGKGLNKCSLQAV